MELRVLMYFVTVVQEGNISKAANVLHLSQSTLSRQIQNLEEELGSILLERDQKPIGLTDNGKFLYSRAQEMLQIANNTTEIIKSNELVTGELEIGVGEDRMQELVAETFGTLVRRYPKIKVNLHNVASDLIPREINRGILDFGFVSNQTNLADFHQLPINYQDRWGILMKKENPLKVNGTITPTDLANQRIILARQNGLIRGFKEWLGNVVKQVRFVGTYDMTVSMHSLVRNGVGMAVTFDRDTYHQESSEFTFIPLNDFTTAPVKLIWKKDRPQSQLEQLFISEFQHVKP